MKKYIVIAAVLLLILAIAVMNSQVPSRKNTEFGVHPMPQFEKVNLTDHYDVVVVGGEPEGIAAAVSSARNGNSTLLVVQEEGIGGLMTTGMLNFLDTSNDMHGNPANAGIFAEWHDLVGSEVAFDIETATSAFLQLIEAENELTVITEAQMTNVLMQGKTLTGIEIMKASGETQQVQAKRFIDSTQDADLAVEAGAPYFNGGADIGLEDRKMAVTLMLHFDNVNWREIKWAAKNGRFGGGKANSNAIWGFSELHDAYQPLYPEETRLRGLNIARQSDNSIVINALQIFGIDGLDQQSRNHAIRIGKEETDNILTFLQENFPGFEEAEIASYPEQLYVRETRHILAEYQLPMSDVWENNDQWDSIGFGAYPVDVQATSVHNYGFVYSDPVQYAIPFRSLVPLEIDNLLVASKASGYGSIAAGSARVLPTGMTAGEAAGAAAELSINHNVSFREMASDKELINKLQTRLKEQGANLYPFDLKYPYEGKWFYPGIKTLLKYGLVSGGYANDLSVEDPITETTFVKLLSNGVIRTETEKLDTNNTDNMKAMATEDQTLTRDKAAELLLGLFGIEENETALWAQAAEEGLIDLTAMEQIKRDRPLNKAEGYYIAGKVIDKLEK